MDCNTTIDCHCNHHVGDNLINMHFFSQIKNYIELNNIYINYHCHQQYHENVKLFLSSTNITILPHKQIGYSLWQANENIFSGKFIEEILCDMFNAFLKAHQIPIVLDKFEYCDDNLLITSIEHSLNNIDVLVINSPPKSGQLHYDISEFNNFIIALNNRYRVAVTDTVNDDIVDVSKYNIRQIASLAKTVKIVIAINTGPSLGLYNQEITNNVDAIYILDSTDHYHFKTNKFAKYKNIRDLNFLL